MLNILLDFGYTHKISNLLIAGDFFDEIQFSDFDTSSEDMVNLDEEVESGKAIYKSLQGVFKNIHFTTGNHDVRLWKKLIRAGKVNDKTWKTMWNLIDGDMRVSPYRYCEVNNYWRITHPKYAVRIGSLGGMPGIRYRAKLDRSMIFAHGHWWGMVQDPSGKYYMILPGCMVDQNKIAYSNVWDTPYENWHNGFLYVEKGNIPHLIDERIAKSKIWVGK